MKDLFTIAAAAGALLALLPWSRLWLLLTWAVVGEPRREEAKRSARNRAATPEPPAPAAEARIRARWAAAESQARRERMRLA